MAECYVMATRETDPVKLGMMMATWDTYRCLIADAERHKDISEMRRELDRANAAWEAKAKK